MNTEQHVWEYRGVGTRRHERSESPVCACGQDLDVCAGLHCPRCGTALLLSAA